VVDGSAASDLSAAQGFAQATSSGQRAAPTETTSHDLAPLDPLPSDPAPLDLGDWVPDGRILELSGAPAGLGAEARTAGARTTGAVSLVVHAQRRGEPVAWVERAAVGALYPPDLADAGVDLDRLVVVRVPDQPRGAAPSTGKTTRRDGRTPRGRLGGTTSALRAAELLLRSGAFGLVVVDLVDASAAGATGAVCHGTRGGMGGPGHPVRRTTGNRRNGGGERLGGTRDRDVWLGRLAALARRHGSRLALLTGTGPQDPSLGALVATRLGPRRAGVGPGLHRVEVDVLKDKAGRRVTHGPPRGELRRSPWGAVGPSAGAPRASDTAVDVDLSGPRRLAQTDHRTGARPADGDDHDHRVPPSTRARPAGSEGAA
jgi:recombination protein RecA